jgi:ADP-ribosylation factor-like protein 13B
MFTLANNFYKWVKRRQEKSLTIILLGLDNAGKSTLLYGLKNELPQSDMTPTIGFRPSKLVSGKYTIQWFDVGGAKNFRRVWQNYYSEVSAGSACPTAHSVSFSPFPHGAKRLEQGVPHYHVAAP